MELKEAISRVTTELGNDIDYRRGWIANIAMAYIDCERWYKEKTGKTYLNQMDKHTIANNAAEHFLNLFCKGNPEDSFKEYYSFFTGN